MSWVVVLAGATLTAMLPAYRYAEGKPIAGREFVDALLVLSVLARAQNEGGPVRLRADQRPAAPHAAPLRGGARARRAPGLDGAHRQGRLGAGARRRRCCRSRRSTRRSRSMPRPGASAERRPRAHPAAVFHQGKGMNSIPRAERLIVALDVPTPQEARALAEKLGDAARFYKIGLELFTADGYFELLALAHRARQQGVRRPQALRHPGDGAARGRQPARPRRHLPHRARPPLGDGGRGAREGRHEDPRGDGAHQLRPARPGGDGQHPQRRATGARAGARRGRERLRRRDLVGPRGAGAEERSSATGCWWSRRASARSRAADDQKRTVDVAQAFANGADYIVVGRPIREAPTRARRPQAIQATIAKIFRS